jgi:hypothetical protein
MKRLFVMALMMFTVGLVSPAAVAQLQSHTQRVMRSAYGGECKSVADVWACASVVAQQERDWEGRYLQTFAAIDEYFSHADGYEARWVRCPIDAGKLQVAQNWASLSVSIDTESPDCVRYGEKVTWDPYTFEPYYFTGIVTAEGNWLSPGVQFKQIGNTVYTFNATGEQQRETCWYYGSWQILGGGFTVQGTFHPFGTPDSSGDFTSTRCNTIAH